MVWGDLLHGGARSEGGGWYSSMHWADPPGETATAADGMHSTGMLSCFDLPTHCFTKTDYWWMFGSDPGVTF